MCVSRGPGQDMFGSAEIIGERQFVAAQKIWDGATQDIGAGGVDYRHIFVDMGKQNVTLADGTFGKTCNPAMGYAFAAGTTDGPGAFDFTQGSNSSNPFWNLVSGFISKPTKEEEACHAPKPILLNTGDCTFPYPWSPHVVPVQLFRVGQLVILAVPTEFTTMAGRRMREAIKKLLVAKGALTSEGVVVIAGLANTYADYTTTFEEYQEQRYEGGSTLYGPHSHAAYVQIMSELATAMADGKPAAAGVPCPDYTSKQVELLPGVITDGTPLGKKFGDVVTDVAGTNFTAGARVFARWYAGCPRNDVRLEGTFSAVQRQGTDGTWATVADDGDWETRFIWERESTISDVSYATVQWDIPLDTPPGTYRLVHTGDAKDILQKKKSYTGTSSAFNVV